MTTGALPNSASRTDPGRSRDQNEDFVGQRSEHRANNGIESLYVVCDGMGGHPAGEVASEIAVTTMLSSYFDIENPRREDALRQAVTTANMEILKEGRLDPRKRGMGATCVAAVVAGEEAVVAHVGDCRAYLITEDAIRRLTSDHSWVGEQVRAGLIDERQALASPYRSIVTRALGIAQDSEPDVSATKLEPGQRLLLCSDGLWDVLADDEIAGIVQANPVLQEAADALIKAANNRGGPDNISVLLVTLAEDGHHSG